MYKVVALKPRLNEKTYGLSTSRVYVFDVDKSVNKTTVAKAVEDQFDVKVNSVNMMRVLGKSKRTISINGKRQLNAEGKRADYKKAYVTLQEGYALPFFEAVEAEEQKEQAIQQKVDRAAAKQVEKASKPAHRGFHLRTRKTPSSDKGSK